jgi:hypothetical protein
VVALRPSCGARFSTNSFHHTWHVLSDGAGALVLARLMWSLAYQRARRTIVVLGPEHLVSTPFDGDPAQPIVLVNTDLGCVDAQDLRAVRAHLARPSDVTVRLQTFGLQLPGPARPEPNEGRERVERIGGCVVYSASPAALRATARAIYAMRDCTGMEYRYLGASRHCVHADGEVQVLRDFRVRVSAARVARRAIAEDARVLTESQREVVWRDADARVRRASGSC